MKLVAVIFVVVAGALACTKPPPATQAQPQPATGARTPVFAKGDPKAERFEGATFKNACASDADCKMAGCSSEVCSADGEITTTCDVLPDQPRDASCGCVSHECVWYLDAAAPAANLPAQGMPCLEGKCAQGLSCVKYLGIAGARGPGFTSCEVPCPLPDSTCPLGQKCITIADGPGRVCRPS